MAVRGHVIITLAKKATVRRASQPRQPCQTAQPFTDRVDHRLRAHFDLEHGCPQHMARVVGLDLQLIIHLQREKKVSLGLQVQGRRS